jgi:hypothetical protein
MKNTEETLAGYRKYACAALSGLLARDGTEAFCRDLVAEEIGIHATQLRLTGVQIINLAAELLAIEAESHERDRWIALREGVQE